MARTYRTTVKYKRNRETVIESAVKASRRDRTQVIETEISEYHDSVANAERREARTCSISMGYGTSAMGSMA